MAYDFKEYDNTVNYLYSLQKHGIKLGLSNINKLMDILGRPQKSFRSIHIAGTNGKGSTATIIASILKESGFKVGLFTSPHLVSFTERIRIDNRYMAESDVIELASKIRDSIADTDLNPTFFEFVTAMAFYYFARNNIDWAVVETGMGGRLDATNVIQPDVTIITNVTLDHCEFLGNRISDITYEKAGIIKPRVPVITTSEIPDVIKQISDIASSHNSEVHIYDKDFRGSLISMDDKQIAMNYSGYNNYNNLLIPLTGKYQIYNTCAAIRACEILRQEGFSLPRVSIRKGLQNVDLKGRLERVSQSPPIFLDSAHNPEAAKSLAASVKIIFPDKQIILIAGVMDDKDIQEILKPLVQISESVILTKPQYERAAPTKKLKEITTAIQETGANYVPSLIATADTVADALDLAKTHCIKDRIILITGSFYTTGEAKEVLGYTGVLSRLREQKSNEN